MNHQIRTSLVIAAVLISAACGANGERGHHVEDSDESRETNAVLERVIDGDTLELNDGTRVRLIGLDTPETQHPEFGDECYGHAATRFARTLLQSGDQVRLSLDAETHDWRGRLLAYVYRASDDVFVNARLTRAGYAYVSTIPPNVAHAALFRRLAAKARSEGSGLWSRCDVEGSKGGQRPPPSTSGPCLPQYEGACVPPGPPDYDCEDFDGPIAVNGDDPHDLDANGDGVACATPADGDARLD